MNRKEAKEYIKSQEPTFLQEARKPANGRPTYVCPVCGNGSGENGDGIAWDKKAQDGHYKCFVCDLYEDNIGLWKKAHNVMDDKTAFSQLYNFYGVMVDEEPTAPRVEPNASTSVNNFTVVENTTPLKKDYTEYFKQCAQNVDHTNYLKETRGLSDEIIKKYMLGYDEHFQMGESSRTWKAIIIPTSRTSYIARNIEAVHDNRYCKRGSDQIYQYKRLKEAKTPIFITEGAIDALSIIELGHEAVALGSTNNANKLLEMVKKEKPSQPLIIALDADQAGKEKSKELLHQLTEAGIEAYERNPYGMNKDANASLVASRAQFKEDLDKEVQIVAELKEQAERERREAYKSQTSNAGFLQAFIDGIKDSVNTPYIPTGYAGLDKALDGGLYEGLYAIGAVSSLGKTTFCLQMLDQIAEAGTDVIIFSLEMGRNELIAKSISRLTLLDVLINGGNMQHAKTNRGITTGSRWAKYCKEEKDLIKRAIENYSKYAGNIYIHEGIGNIGAKEIRETVENHITLTGKRPVVLVDYLQIMAPADIKASDKQNTDKAVLELKRMSRDFKIPVIGISSLNRQSYKEEASMSMFKESGAIEYGSDVVFGLQFKGVKDKKNFNEDEAKAKDPRDIELKILKNRNGRVGDVIGLEFYPLFNYFKEV